MVESDADNAVALLLLLLLLLLAESCVDVDVLLHISSLVTTAGRGGGEPLETAILELALVIRTLAAGRAEGNIYDARALREGRE